MAPEASRPVISRPATWLPRTLHPVAWWLWALALATVASATTNPLLLLLVVAVCAVVVAARRTEAPWALAFRLYVVAGVLVVALRVAFRVVLGSGTGTTVLLELPEVPLPHWVAGITLLGPVTAESLLGGAYDGLRLATMLICVGAANALANPKRLLKALPPALHEVAASVVVALSVFPQLAESVVRVGRARSLRLGGTRRSALRSVVVPVLEDALDRSLLLAASMDARGYGRTGSVSRRTRWGTGALMVGGLLGILVGVYGVLDPTTSPLLRAPMLAAGLVVGLAGLALSGRVVQRSVHAPDRWRAAELLTVASGSVAAAATLLAGAPQLYPSLEPLSWPQLPVVPTAGLLVALLPAVLTPPASSARRPALAAPRVRA
ncbi:MAG: energy-coupling factor transporter transmembrane component T [Nocardioidaceae bacterium]